MKYLIAILIVILAIVFFPQILGAVIGSALVIALIPGARILIGVVIILFIFSLLMNNSKRKRKSGMDKDFTSSEIRK